MTTAQERHQGRNEAAGDTGTATTRIEPPVPGALLLLAAVRYRVVAYVGERVLMTSVTTHHPWLEQDPDGSIQLPTTLRLLEMMHAGIARPCEPEGGISPTEKLRFEIDLLDAAGVRQGDKCIWQFLAKAWTPDLVARFGQHDDPWRIRRWRAALRKSAAEAQAS